MSMSMPRSALRHRPIGPADIQEWVIAPPQRQAKPHSTGGGLPWSSLTRESRKTLESLEILRFDTETFWG